MSPFLRIFLPLLISSVPAGVRAADADAEALFAARILPLLKARCLACHGEDESEIEGGLDLRTLDGLLAGGDSAVPAVVPGRPEASPLYLAVTREHEDWEAMPPKDNDRLGREDVAYIRDWIAGGAPWPDRERLEALATKSNRWAVGEGIPVRTSGGLSSDWTNRLYKPEDLWAYQPLRKPEVPPTVPSTPDGAQTHPVDAFINARLAAMNIAPAPPTDRRALIRRATFDLTGLPPSPEDVSAFIADPATDEEAFARIIDRLLASPHYGEQWGQHWLDVTRYADSSGLANDFARGNTWRYRDYVVRAFNDDKPYDEFIREQIAGDEIAEARRQGTESAADESRATPESALLVATGFLRMGPWELTSMEVPKVARQKLLDDMTDSVGQVVLATPLQCARCHDHKFDPVPTRDYYSFQAIFATTQIAVRPAEFLPVERTDGFEEQKFLRQRERTHREVLKRLDRKSIAAARAWYVEQHLDPADFERALREAAAASKRDTLYSAARAALRRQGVPEERIPPKAAGFTPQDFGHERIASKGLQRIRWELDRYKPLAFSVYSGRTPAMKAVTAPLQMPEARMTQGELEQTCILTGGDPFASGGPAPPGVLSAPTFLAGMDEDLACIPEEITGRRLALANWIASPDNPLTARVMVNRIWQWHFGQAIAGNPNNFGATGKKPTHPELLDWLAATFVEGAGANGRPWSIKAMHRLIMSSGTYRRSVEHPDPEALARQDPLGESYAVFKPRRLTAEELRDAMLAVSGELNLVVGGIPVRPEINREAALQPRQLMGTFAEAWQPSPLPSQRHRRSIYTLKLRGQSNPFMEVFNAPSPDLSCEAREASTVTPQVFALFNSEATLGRAIAMATRVQRETSSRAAAITRAFELAYGRPPTPEEQGRCLEHLTRMTARHRTLSFPRPEFPREVVREAIEENTGETFTFVERLEVAAEFVPDLQPADASPETRALADLCLVFLNTNEFIYLY